MNIERIGSPLNNARTLALSPSQQSTLSELENLLNDFDVVGLFGLPGSGRTTLANALCDGRNARTIGCAEIVDWLIGTSPNKLDEVIASRLQDAFDNYDLIAIDDYQMLVGINTSDRADILKAVIMPALQDAATKCGCKLVLVCTNDPSAWWLPSAEIVGPRAAIVHAPAMLSDDYKFVAENVLGADRIKSVDFRRLHSFASMLNCYELVSLFRLASTGGDEGIDTATLIGCLEDWVLKTNLKIGEVEELEFSSLPGTEEIAEQLETHVIIPFESQSFAKAGSLKPKRGVLLYGPPGTGKTSIGRALAHRMKGKFFMIDGTLISEPPTAFFAGVQAIVAEAKANSPCVLFIDDADLLFEIEHISGFSRYLLSLLDGIESETAGNVCVMMTAMDVRKIPDALMRSGRVELWLETKPPDLQTREQILRRWVQGSWGADSTIDFVRIANMTAGFTPADLRRVASDARLLYAADLTSSNAIKETTSYFTEAVNEIVSVRKAMAEQLSDSSLLLVGE